MKKIFLCAMGLLVCACGDAAKKHPSNTNPNNSNSENLNNINSENLNSGNNSNNNTAASCAAPAELEEVEHEIWDNPCSERSPELGFYVYTNPVEFSDDLDCGEIDPEVNFESHRIVWVTVYENPVATLAGVVEDDDGDIVIYAASPAYCGGAAPSDSGFFVKIPADSRPVAVVVSCTYGSCNFPNNQLPPGMR